MTPMTKMVIACVAAAWVANKAVDTFTDDKDSKTEKLLWQLGAAGVVGFVASKAFKS